MAGEHPSPKDDRDNGWPFAAAVRPDERGGWLAEVNLGAGASLTKWFVMEEDAVRYLQELADWLRGHRSE